MRETIINLIAKHTGLPVATVAVDHSEHPAHGDYASPIAFVLAKKQKRPPMIVAEELKKAIENDPGSKEFFVRVEVALPGYLNFFLSPDVFAKQLAFILENPDDWGKNSALVGKKIMVEYTDPNPFKEFHIGHLMSNAIGEAISRIVEFSGAEVKRANYQGDVGLHVAKAVWGMKHVKKEEAYAHGAATYENDENAKKEIQEINRAIFEKSDEKINALYEEGKQWSLDRFEKIYQRLGTRFDEYFFESETGRRGKEIVKDALKKGIFEKSDGAVVYRGEKKGLHTRVFINSEGLPTYEAKELGLAFIKQERWSHNISFVVTGNEIIEYFRVVMAALSEIDEGLARKIIHVPHGFLRLKSGKMSSRTGEIIRAEDLLNEAKKKLHEKTNNEIIAEVAAVGAVKYSILRQSTGKDIIFDFNTSLSFEGDSGPYLQYTHARVLSVLEKSKKSKGGTVAPLRNSSHALYAVERFLFWFPDVVREALHARDPHFIAHYLSDLAQAFNSFYAKERILGADDEEYKLALTVAVAATLKNGLWLLGISAPERM